jgi:hypothetical protein
MTNKCTLDTYSFCRDFEKIAPYPSCHRDYFLAKVPGPERLAAPGIAYYLHQPAVISYGAKIIARQIRNIYQDEATYNIYLDKIDIGYLPGQCHLQYLS